MNTLEVEAEAEEDKDSRIELGGGAEHRAVSVGFRFSLRPTVGETAASGKQKADDADSGDGSTVPSISSFLTRSREINLADLPPDARLDEVTDEYQRSSEHSLPNLPLPTVDLDEEEVSEPNRPLARMVLSTPARTIPPRPLIPAAEPVPSAEQNPRRSVGIVNAVASTQQMIMTIAFTSLAFFWLTRSNPHMYTTNENSQSEYMLIKPYVPTGLMVNGKPTPAKMVVFEPEQLSLLNGTSLVGGTASIYNSFAFTSVFGTVFDVTSHQSKLQNSPMQSVLGKEASSIFAGVGEKCDLWAADDTGLLAAYEWYTYLSKLDEVGTMGVLHGPFYDETGRSTSQLKRLDAAVALAQDKSHKIMSSQSSTKSVNSPEQGGFLQRNHACKTLYSPRKGGMAFCEQYVPKVRRGWHVERQQEQETKIVGTRERKTKVHVAGMNRLRAQQRGDFRSQQAQNERYNVSEQEVEWDRFSNDDHDIEGEDDPVANSGLLLDPVWFPREVLVVVVDVDVQFGILMQDPEFQSYLEAMREEAAVIYGQEPKEDFDDVLSYALAEEERKTFFYDTLSTAPGARNVRQVLRAVQFGGAAPQHLHAQVAKAKTAVQELGNGCECITRAQESAMQHTDLDLASQSPQKPREGKTVFRTFSEAQDSNSIEFPVRAKLGTISTLYRSKDYLRAQKARESAKHATGKQYDDYWKQLHNVQEVEFVAEDREITLDDVRENIKNSGINFEFTYESQGRVVKKSTFSEAATTANKCAGKSWPGPVDMNEFLRSGSVKRQSVQARAATKKQGSVTVRQIRPLPLCEVDAVVCSVDSPSITNNLHSLNQGPEHTPSWLKKKNKG